jgi:hypothetical protein
MANKKYEVIRPKSLQSSAYEDFEYLIRWVGRDGSEYLFMFYDVEIQRRIRSEVINSESSDNIEALISEEKRNISLFADDLSEADLNIILQLFGNKFVTRLKKDDTIERFAPEANNYKYRLIEGHYEIEFTLIASNLAVWS